MYCCFLCRQLGHCGHSSEPLLASALFLSGSGSAELNGLYAVVGVGLGVGGRVGEADREEAVDVTLLTSTPDIICKCHKNSK